MKLFRFPYNFHENPHLDMAILFDEMSYRRVCLHTIRNTKGRTIPEPGVVEEAKDFLKKDEIIKMMK